ncbi:MAG: hypothetical protein WCX71_00890 [Candidatus Buchananbacteria bacterium]
MSRIIIGLIIVIIGAIITIKSDWFYRNFGTIPSFEKYLGTEGGSRLGYQLIGIVAAIIGFMVMTNLIGGFLMATVGKLFTGNLN